MEPVVYNNNGITIINSDILNANIPNESVDLIVTSPPYNAGMPYEPILTEEEYFDFVSKVCGKLYVWLKPDGRFCINICFNINRKQEDKTLAMFPFLTWVDALRTNRLEIKSNVVWNQNYNDCDTAWGSYQSSSSPHIRCMTEYIIVGYKKQWKKLNKGKSSINSEEFTTYTQDFWKFEAEHNRNHPAPFPEELPTRCLKLFSYVGDTILDPFMGSGTTLISAFKHKRKAIGVDISKQYCDYAVNRLKMAGINGEANFRRMFK